MAVFVNACLFYIIHIYSYFLLISCVYFLFKFLFHAFGQVVNITKGREFMFYCVYLFVSFLFFFDMQLNQSTCTKRIFLRSEVQIILGYCLTKGIIFNMPFVSKTPTRFYRSLGLRLGLLAVPETMVLVWDSEFVLSSFLLSCLPFSLTN